MVNCDEEFCLKSVYTSDDIRFQAICFASVPDTCYSTLICDLCLMELGRVETSVLPACLAVEANHIQVVEDERSDN